MKKEYVYLVCCDDEFELAVGVFDTLSGCASFLSVSSQAVLFALRWGCVCRGKYRVEKVYLNG